MRLVKIWFLAGLFCLLNCNFGMVEYAALHPQTEKVVRVDSTQKQLAYAPNKEIASIAESNKPSEENQISFASIVWSGITYLSAMMLKILTSLI
jgi:hypothetical protein